MAKTAALAPRAPTFYFARRGLAIAGTWLQKIWDPDSGWEPWLGYGCEAEDELVQNEPLKLNFRGYTYKTRQLYTVVPKVRYSKNPRALEQLVLHWSQDLQSCFRPGGAI